MSIEREQLRLLQVSRKYAELRALGMAKDAGIELTPEQVEWYIAHRTGKATFDQQGVPGDQFVPHSISDGPLFDLIPDLTPDQRLKLNSHDPVIFPGGGDPKDI